MNPYGDFTGPAAILQSSQRWEKPTMADLLYLALALGAFAAVALAVEACERL
jgi:hypothetical protein